MTPRGVLLTGFDAFGGADRNPSELATRALHGRTIAGHRVRALVLPTAFAAAPAALAAALARPVRRQTRWATRARARGGRRWCGRAARAWRVDRKSVV